MRRAYAQTSCGQLHYREAGEGQPLVLLHMTASSSLMFGRALPLLAPHYRAIALDTPGFGASDPLPGVPTIPDYARALEEFLDALGLNQVDLVGFHTGASVGLELAVSNPERVGGLIVAAILAVQDEEEAERWTELIVQPWEPDGRGEFLQHVRWWLSMYVPPDDGEAYLAELVGTLAAGPSYYHAPAAVIAYDALGALGRLRTPTLFLSPVEDNLFQETCRAHAAAPGSAYVEIPGGDGACWQHPEAFAAAVLDFLGAG